MTSKEREVDKNELKFSCINLKKNIKSKLVNGVFWRRLKYVGLNYEQ